MAKAFVRSIQSKRRRRFMKLGTACRQEVERAMDTKIKPALVKSHERIVEDWSSDVGFAAKKIVGADSIAVYVYPTGEDKKIWIFVDRGTEPHPITAKNAPRLAFMMSTKGGKPVRGGYVPKTLAKPARTVAGGGYVKSPKALVMPMTVDHPGSEGRGFTEAIAKDIRPEFVSEIENAYRRASRRAGYR